MNNRMKGTNISSKGTFEVLSIKKVKAEFSVFTLFSHYKNKYYIIYLLFISV